jgi:hypothetical protein
MTRTRARISRMSVKIARLRAARPAAAKPVSMPADDGIRLHDNQRRPPVLPTSRERHPKESVASPEAASRGSVEGGQLLPQRQVFQGQFSVAAECQRECADHHDEYLQHAGDRCRRWRETQLGRVLASVTYLGTKTSASWNRAIVGCTSRTNRQDTPSTSQARSARQNLSWAGLSTFACITHTHESCGVNATTRPAPYC